MIFPKSEPNNQYIHRLHPIHSSRPNERYSNGVNPVRFLKKEKKYSVDWKPRKKEISFTDWEVPTSICLALRSFYSWKYLAGA